MQTQTSNTLHNAIMEAGSKDHPPMLALGNYIQWKSRIKRYIDTKPNHELIHHCLKNPPYKFTVNQSMSKILKPIYIGNLENSHHGMSQELKTVSYHKLYGILKHHQNEVNEIRAERIARVANPLALVAQQQQPVYNPQTHPTHYTQNSLTRSQQAATRNIGKAIEFVHVAKECQKPKRVKDAAYHREKMLLCKQEEAGIQLNAEQADWRDDTDDELEDQELEAHYMYMAKHQEISPDAADSGPIFDAESLQKVSNDDHYNMFAIESEHPESIHNTYPIKQDEHNVIIDSLDMSYDREQIDQSDDDADLVNERELLASLIEKLKCEIDDSKNHNKFLETSNKVLIEKLKGEIEDFKNKNKCLESSNNRFKEANNKLSETNNLLYTDFKKSQAELARCKSVEYASKVEIDCAKARGDLISYKMESQKSFNRYTQTINYLNQTISEMKNKLCTHQETISILSQQKEDQIKLYKTREDKELEKVIDLENKVKLVEIFLFIVDSGCSKHMTENLKLLINFVEKFLGTVKFRNDQIAPILGYGDLVQGAVMIKWVYYVEGLNHNLFSVGQFCDADLEVAFRKSTCYIRDLKGNDLLTGSRGTDLYSITLQDINSPNRICLMAKATSSQAWLWHRRLSHLNFDAINLLSKNDIVVGLPKLKFFKDHLCSSCKLGKAKQKSFHTKINPSSKRRYNFYTWNYVTLHAYFAAEGILHQTSVARTPEQNGVVKRRNRTLVEAVRTMLSAAKVPLFFWAEAIATTCFTQNFANFAN
nr:integrase, catalytic region, zinc finger, CCHC-type, peptidase aspartic, catalytic [Tanacetum cinerariifolium]